MIKSMKLTNWKTHENTQIDFQKGTNVIVGLMGAGKSSMMDAMSFALFGTFPALEHRRYKVEDIIMNRPKKKDSAGVELELVLGDDTYKIYRTISRSKKAEAKIEKNGQYLQTQSERVNEEIESLLKINYDVFSRAIYSEQNKLDYFLELRKGERKKQIDEMLGLDRFALAEENATSLANAIKSYIQEDEKLIENADPKSMHEKSEALHREQELEKQKEAELSKTAKSLHEALSRIKHEYQKMKEQVDAKTLLSKDISGLESRISTLTGQLEKIKLPDKTLQELESERFKISDELKAVDKEIESLQAKEKEAIRERSTLDAQLKQCISDMEKESAIKKEIGRSNLEEIKEFINSKNAEVKNSVSKLADSKSKLAEAQKWLEELKKHESKCPICERSLTEELRKRLLDERDSLIKSLKEEISVNESKVKSAEKELLALNSKFNEVNALTAKLASYKGSSEKAESLRGKLATAEANVDKLTKAFEATKPKRDALAEKSEKNKSEIDAIKRADSIKLEIEASKKALDEANFKISNIKVTDKELEELRESYNAKNAEYAKTNAELKASSEASSKLQLQIEEIIKSIAKLNEIEQKVSERRKVYTNVMRFKNALIDTEVQLRTRLVSSINELLEQLWIGLYPYGDYSGIALRAYPDDYSLEAAVDIGGERAWVQVDGVSSGGERSIACLALRIAMSMVIVPNLKWLILDEPTHNLDAQGISKMIEVFSNSLPSIVEQIFVITHDDALKQVHGARIYEFSRDKSINEPTKIDTG
ncbi:MAG: SMC family ATPase [Methanothrix sp.]